MTDVSDQEIIDGEHDCRDRVRSGHAELQRVDHLENGVRQLAYECDECGRDVYEIAEVYNIQIAQTGDAFHGSVLEPGPGVERSEIYDAPLGPS